MQKDVLTGCVYSKKGEKEQEEKLLQPYTYLLQVPGKNIRAKLACAFNYWLKIPKDKLDQIVGIIQLLHNATLLLDDIEDNSVLRRGIPAAHSVYGVPSTINAANYAIILGAEKCLQLNHPKASEVYIEQLLEILRGQGMEIYWRDNFICPSEEEYSEMTKKKTGDLFLLVIRLMQLFSKNTQDFTKLTGIIGLSFQIQDDYANLAMEGYMLNKSYCEDLTEGKFSYPLIHAIKSRPDDDKVIRILKQHTTDDKIKKYCVSLLEEYGSFEYTRAKIQSLKKEALEEVKQIGENPYMEEFLNLIYLVDDNHAIFLFKDTSQAWIAKDFIVDQERFESITFENKVYEGKHKKNLKLSYEPIFFINKILFCYNNILND